MTKVHQHPFPSTLTCGQLSTFNDISTALTNHHITSLTR